MRSTCLKRCLPKTKGQCSPNRGLTSTWNRDEQITSQGSRKSASHEPTHVAAQRSLKHSSAGRSAPAVRKVTSHAFVDTCCNARLAALNYAGMPTVLRVLGFRFHFYS